MRPSVQGTLDRGTGEIELKGRGKGDAQTRGLGDGRRSGRLLCREHRSLR